MSRAARRIGATLRPRGRHSIWAVSALALVLNALRARRRLAALAVVDAHVPGPPAAAGMVLASGPGTDDGTASAADRASRASRAPDAGGPAIDHGPVPAGGLGTAAGPRTTAAGTGGAPDVGGVSDRGDRYVLVAADGVRAADASVAAAVRHAEEHDLDVLDLVPADLDAERAYEAVRLVDPATYRGDRLAAGRGAAQALLVARDLLGRIGWTAPAGAVGEADLADLLVEAKRFAPAGCDLAVAPGVHAAPEIPGRRRALVEAVSGGVAPVALALPFAGLGALAAGAVVSPWWAAVAAVAYCGQPALAAGRLPDGGVAALAARPVRNLARAVGVARSPGRASAPGTSGADDGDRARYRAVLDDGLGRLFEARRDTCPWCGGDALEALVTCRDDVQSKPGTFRLDRCRACGHVFQNPALSAAGLDFYYGDFYDGVGEDELAFLFGSSPTPYRKRARMVRRHWRGADPGSWLDVGTGHGHFCLMAREEFPKTRFEGLDLGESVTTAAQRGWIDQAHRGLLPELAEGLAGRFDVVSMLHCLEHTRDPGAELVAARRVLRPGGHLLIEVPDPECRAGTVLGQWWGPWFQPQHQHLIPIANLGDRLRDAGFTVVAAERRQAHAPVELASATWLVLGRLAPKVGQPWQPPARWTGTARRVAVFAVGLPVLGAALVADRLAVPVVSRLPGGPNAYRLLARLDPPPGGGAGGPGGGDAEPTSLAGDDRPSAAPPAASGSLPPPRTAPAGNGPGEPDEPGGPGDADAAPPPAGPRRPRRRRRRSAPPPADDLATAGHPDPTTWCPGLLEALGPVIGAGRAGLRLAGEPAALEPHHGPWAFSFRLAGGGLPEPWGEPLVARLAEGLGELRRDAAAIETAAARGLGVPEVLALVPLAGEPGAAGAPGPGWALVTRHPTGEALPELIGRNLSRSDDLMSGFAGYHARLHDATSGIAGDGAVPRVDAEAEIDRFAAGTFGAEVDWLRRHRPEPGGAVLCHGGYQPLCAFGPGADRWEETGGPGTGLTAVGWHAAALADPECDVAFTLVAFWSAPAFARSRSDRTTVKMIRNTLSNGYRRAYVAHRPLDAERLHFWQAFHALRGLARLQGTYRYAGSPFELPERAPLPAALAPELERYVQLVTRR